MAKQVRTVQRARRQRREMSLPEVMLWQRLRGAPEGIRFRRQHPFGPFVLDFYCAQAKLAIEVDGIVHTMGDQPAFDDKRTECSVRKGSKFFAFLQPTFSAMPWRWLKRS